MARPESTSIVGRDWLNYFQYRIEPKNTFSNTVSYITKTLPTGPWVNEMQAEFLDLFVKKGRIKYHKIHTRRRNGNKTTERPPRTNSTTWTVKKEINWLLQEGHKVKVQDIKENVFLQPTVFTVKKDRSVKINLDARELNKNVVKDKYAMPNLDNLLDMFAEHAEQGPGKTFSQHWIWLMHADK